MALKKRLHFHLTGPATYEDDGVTPRQQDFTTPTIATWVLEELQQEYRKPEYRGPNGESLKPDPLQFVHSLMAILFDAGEVFPPAIQEASFARKRRWVALRIDPDDLGAITAELSTGAPESLLRAVREMNPDAATGTGTLETKPAAAGATATGEQDVKLLGQAAA